jgi:phage gpG-like protein
MSITITGLEKVMRNLSPAQIEAPKRRFMKRIALIVERRAKQRVRVKRGHLRRSITHDVAPNGNRAIVGTNVKYGPYQEFGTGSRGDFPKGLRNGHPWGITPNRFLRGGLQDSQGKISTEVSRFSRELAGKMGGA